MNARDTDTTARTTPRRAAPSPLCNGGTGARPARGTRTGAGLALLACIAGIVPAAAQNWPGGGYRGPDEGRPPQIVDVTPAPSDPAFWAGEAPPPRARRSPARSQAAPRYYPNALSSFSDDPVETAPPEDGLYIPRQGRRYAALPADDIYVQPGQNLPDIYRRQVVTYQGREAPGTLVVDTRNKFLYLVQPGGTAIRYGIGVGREGFQWRGMQNVSAKREWPGWRPPAEMLKRRPDLPRYMEGGPDNPLGARAIYLGSTLYRIHGTNEPDTIGHNVSSGCIRLTNEDVIDLYERVSVGTRVVVL